MERWPVQTPEQQVQQAGPRLDQEHPLRDGRRAVATPPPREQVAQYRRQVTRCQESLAGGAVGAGAQDRLPSRKTVDADVEEAADGQPEQHSDDAHHHCPYRTASTVNMTPDPPASSVAVLSETMRASENRPLFRSALTYWKTSPEVRAWPASVIRPSPPVTEARPTPGGRFRTATARSLDISWPSP